MLTPLQRAELKGVADVAFKLAGGNQACALISRIARLATFSDYINPAIEDRSVPLDVAIDVDRYNLQRGGDAWLIRAAAQLLGFILVRKPVGAVFGNDVDGLLEAARETTEAVAAGWSARADGHYSTEEIAHLDQQIDEAMAALEGFRAAVVATAESRPSLSPTVKP